MSNRIFAQRRGPLLLPALVGLALVLVGIVVGVGPAAAASPPPPKATVYAYDSAPHFVPAARADPEATAEARVRARLGWATVTIRLPHGVAGFAVAADSAAATGGVRAAGTNSVEIHQEPAALEGLTLSQIDDLAANAGYDVLSGKVGASNPSTRYYVPGTNGSTGFRVLPSGVAGQTGIKAGPYLKFFGGPNNGLRIPLSAS